MRKAAIHVKERLIASILSWQGCSKSRQNFDIHISKKFKKFTPGVSKIKKKIGTCWPG